VSLKLGTLEIRSTKGGIDISASAQLSAIAIHGSEMLFASVVASEADFKVMRAACNSGGSIPHQWVGVGLKVFEPSKANDQWKYPSDPGYMHSSPQGYEIYRHPLGFGSRHYLFVSRNPSFLLVASDEALYRELKSERFTTPLIREWIPYIRKQLATKHMIDECRCYPWEPCPEEACPIPGYSAPLSSVYLCATTKNIDEIVVEGLKNGDIEIPGGDG
jgi:hypothetical protein